MSRLFILLKPKISALKNRWRLGQQVKTNLLFDLILVVLTLGVSLAIYKGVRIALFKTSEFAELVYLPPSVPLSILLLFLFMMLLLSSAVMSLSIYFLSHDNDLVLAAPVSRISFFASKISAVILSTAWMPAVFLCPFLLAFGLHFKADIFYYLSWPLVLAPYFIISALLAFIISILFISLIPPAHTRWLYFVVLGFIVAALYNLSGLIQAGINAGSNYQQLFKILTLLSFPDSLWLPSHWVALAFQALLEKRVDQFYTPLMLLLVALVFLVFLAFVFFTVLYLPALSRSSNRLRPVLNINLDWLTSVLKILPIPSVSLMLKDYKSLYRDLSQVVQLLMLVVVFSIYIYNLRIFGLLETLDPKERSSWLTFFFVANACMGAFITTAAATRLVFPSLSLEGASFWILQTAPISHSQIIFNKFMTWIIPIGILASVAFAAGNFALKLSYIAITVTFIAGWLMTASIVALGLGVGAVFARYDWEYSGQLVASFGSFVFMLCSILLIAFNMLPLGMVLYVNESGLVGTRLTVEDRNVLLLVCGAFLILLNLLVVRISLAIGASALAKQLRR